MNKDEDTRNVVDEFKGMEVEDIKSQLYKNRHRLHIAVENLERDFNMGTIVRNANAFNVETIHIVGRRQWNKRGAMATDLYMNIEYHKSVEDFVSKVNERTIIGIDNIKESTKLHDFEFSQNAVLVFGSEGLGLSGEMLSKCGAVVAIEQFGSTRSVNVGVASGIAMYAWLQQHVL